MKRCQPVTGGNIERKAIIFARVSTARQEKEGLSLKEIQVPAAVEYAEKHGLKVIKTFAIGETGGQYKSRAEFNKMVEFAQRHKEVTDIISLRVDRITRNFHDAVAIDDLRLKYGKRIHFTVDNLILDANSSSNDLLQWDVKVMVARNYLEGVREYGNTTKQTKLDRGELPWGAPFGYKNAGSAGHRTVVLVEPDASIVKEIFEEYATDTYSCDTLATEMNMRYGGFGKSFVKKQINEILRQPFYIGKIYDKKSGKLYQHHYPTLIDAKTFEECANILDGNNMSHKRSKCVVSTPYRGFITCTECGCDVVPDFKVKRQKNGNVHHYRYYHCTNARKKHQHVQNITEDLIDDTMMRILDDFTLTDEQASILRNDLNEMHTTKVELYEEQRNELLKKRAIIKKRQQTTYDLLADGSITRDIYDENSTRYQQELADIEEQERRLEKADEEFYTSVGYLLEVLNGVKERFATGNTNTKQKIVGLLLSNLRLSGNLLDFSLTQPFSNLFSGENGSVWLGMRDSNPRMPGPEPGALPLGESPRREEKENIFSFSDRRRGQFYEVKPSQKGATPRIFPEHHHYSTKSNFSL